MREQVINISRKTGFGLYNGALGMKNINLFSNFSHLDLFVVCSELVVCHRHKTRTIQILLHIPFIPAYSRQDNLLSLKKKNKIMLCWFIKRVKERAVSAEHLDLQHIFYLLVVNTVTDNWDLYKCFYKEILSKLLEKVMLQGTWKCVW